MPHHSSKMPSQRQLKVGEAIRHALSDIFMRGDLYDASGKTLMVTVSEVRISPDLRNATVFVMPLAGKDQQDTVKLLQDMAPNIRHQLGPKLQLRNTPHLHFSLDDSFDEADKINRLLQSE